MELIAAVALIAAAIAVWRAWQAEKCVSQEAAARAEAEERARKEAERASQEAAARAEAEERARKEAERASQEAAARAKAEERARKEAERASQEAAARAKAEERARKEAERAQREAERARNAERRAAKLGSEVAEARVDAVKRADERTLVGALKRALPALEPERAKRLENQLEALARNRADASKLREQMESTADEADRSQLLKKLSKVETDAAALVERLRNIVSQDPALSGVRLALAWEVRSTPIKKK